MSITIGSASGVVAALVVEDLAVRLFDRAGRVTLTKQGAIRFVLCAQNCSGRH